jgi:hypothetical protein
VVLFVSQSAIGWLLVCSVWVLVLVNQSSRRRDPYERRLDQLLLLLVPQTATEARGSFADDLVIRRTRPQGQARGRGGCGTEG